MWAAMATKLVQIQLWVLGALHFRANASSNSLMGIIMGRFDIEKGVTETSSAFQQVLLEFLVVLVCFVVHGRSFGKLKIEKSTSNSLFRSRDLQVVSPARFRCAKLLFIEYR
ncbi:hypothetical protein K440DRAFT_141578 [Wilcoxina mikolae CBS 423.85]|nr:hypothetical protein K440DRAFT_141578 [Wilcoxina mikolae CBS 423.85]